MSQPIVITEVSLECIAALRIIEGVRGWVAAEGTIWPVLTYGGDDREAEMAAGMALAERYKGDWNLRMTEISEAELARVKPCAYCVQKKNYSH